MAATMQGNLLAITYSDGCNIARLHCVNYYSHQVLGCSHQSTGTVHLESY